jgi:hypothetical protein
MTDHPRRGCARAKHGLNYFSDNRAILSAGDHSYPSQPSSNSTASEVAALQSESYQRRSLCLGSIMGVLLVLLGGCITRDSSSSNPSSSTPPLAVASPSPSVTASPTNTSAAPTPVANAAVDGWPLPPLVGGDWVAVDKQGARTLLDHLVERTPPSLVGTAQQITRFRTKLLPFYPGAKLCEGLVPATGSNGASIFSFILLPDNSVTLLDGTVAPIHELDESVPVALDKREQSEAYLRFFAAAVFATGGNFRIVDRMEDPLWAADAADSDKQRAAKYIRPLALEQLDDGRWKANATVQYGTALSSVVFYVEPSGNTSMAEDVTVAKDLPLRRESFNGPLRYEIGLYK